MSANLQYRANSEWDYEPDVIEDVFYAENYCNLHSMPVNEGDRYHFFDNPEDIALRLSTDGFTLFKRRCSGRSTAWPIILINYNLDPKICTRLENILCVGVIPSPTQCKDLNSFLVPLLDELLELEHGIDCSGLTPEGNGYDFMFSCFYHHNFWRHPCSLKAHGDEGAQRNRTLPCVLLPRCALST